VPGADGVAHAVEQPLRPRVGWDSLYADVLHVTGVQQNLLPPVAWTVWVLFSPALPASRVTRRLPRGSGCVGYRVGGIRTYDGGPFADAPPRDQAVRHVRVGGREGGGNVA
jgi:hypothetical protein